MSITLQIEEGLRKNWKDAALKSSKEGKLLCEEIPEFILEKPKDKTHGDYTVNLAMVLAKKEGKKPRDIAEILKENFNLEESQVEKIEIAGPGFLNMYLNKNHLQGIIKEVLTLGDYYGNSNYYQGETFNVEFVSANPTGLLHMGNARGAAIGDTLSNVLKALGAKVSKEYYINDAGKQIENFGKSLEARYLNALGVEMEFPEDGYHGGDILVTVEGYIKKHGDALKDVSEEERRKQLTEYALEEKLDEIATGLARFGIHYDHWFRESSLYADESIKKTIEALEAKEYVYESEGAFWLKGSSIGEEKDEVLVRTNGIPTYFAGDIAYHKNKFDRGFKTAINVWGADHHGHVARLKSAMTAMGYDGDKVEVILMQLVRLYKDGEILRMSKRTGTYVTLEELIGDIGVDAARYFFVMRNPDSHLDFDLDLAKKESSENPVFYIQYAFARICSILRQLEEPLGTYLQNDYYLYEEEVERNLIEKLGELEAVLIESGSRREPYRVATYALELATLFHQFYGKCRVLNEKTEVKASRTKLILATKYTLQNVLKILGVSAPEKM